MIHQKIRNFHLRWNVMYPTISRLSNNYRIVVYSSHCHELLIMITRSNILIPTSKEKFLFRERQKTRSTIEKRKTKEIKNLSVRTTVQTSTSKDEVPDGKSEATHLWLLSRKAGRECEAINLRERFTPIGLLLVHARARVSWPRKVSGRRARVTSNSHPLRLLGSLLASWLGRSLEDLSPNVVSEPRGRLRRWGSQVGV